MILSNKNDKIFAHSLDEAQNSRLYYRHGCVATCGGKIIAKGCNTHKNYSSDEFMDECCSCHAEINVLRQIYYQHRRNKRKLNRIFKNTTLYISRYSTDKRSCTSAPCIDCLRMIKRHNIKKIVFNLNDDYYVMRSKDYETDYVTMGYTSIRSMTNIQQ